VDVAREDARGTDGDDGDVIPEIGEGIQERWMVVSRVRQGDGTDEREGRARGARGKEGVDDVGVTPRASSRAMTTVKEVEAASGTTTTTAKEGESVEASGARGKGANGTTKKMRVEDFEPLKLIGRGAFGA